MASPIGSNNPNSCSICGGNYPFNSLFTCNHGHLFCKSCFKQEYYRGKEKRCPHRNCNSWITRVGHPSDHPNSGDTGVRNKKMFPFFWELSQDKEAELNVSFPYHPRKSTESVVSFSKRPVRCPYPKCNKSVAVSGFDQHFAYEHKLVDSLKNQFDEIRALMFEPDRIQYDETYCLALITIRDSKLSSGTTVIKPTMIVMAARVRCDEDDDSDEDDFSECGNFALTPDDKVVLWVASNVPSKYSFTKAVSSLTKNIRLKYSEPIAAVNYDHEKICHEGRRLILTQNHTRGMTLNGTTPLILEFLIHDAPKTQKEN